jgi:hypothetical protein
MATCGLWTNSKTITAVVVHDDGAVADRYIAPCDPSNSWDLLARIVGEQGLECVLVIPQGMAQRDSLATWAVDRGFAVYIAPEVVVAAVACLQGPPVSPRRMAAGLARLPLCSVLGWYLRFHHLRITLP